MTIYAISTNYMTKGECQVDIAKLILSEYGVDFKTYGLFKFIESVNLLRSLKKIDFMEISDIDFGYFHKQIVKFYKSSNLNKSVTLHLEKPPSFLGKMSKDELFISAFSDGNSGNSIFKKLIAKIFNINIGLQELGLDNERNINAIEIKSNVDQIINSWK